MRIYKTQAQVEAVTKDGVLDCGGEDVTFEHNISIYAHIVNAGNIKAQNIKAWDIKAQNINAWDIKAWDIKAWDIKAQNINAWDINAWDINALNIEAKDISYYAVCFSYEDITCASIKGRRENARHFCLDGVIVIREMNN